MAEISRYAGARSTAYVSSSYSAAEPEFWAKLRQRTIVPGRDSLSGRVLLEGKVVHIEDILADPDYAFPETAASGRRTGLGVPLLREGAVLGTINLSRNRVQPFTERQIELVRTFADQAVIAMENARLLGELQARRKSARQAPWAPARAEAEIRSARSKSACTCRCGKELSPDQPRIGA